MMAKTKDQKLAEKVALLHKVLDNSRHANETLEQWQARVTADTWNANRKALHKQGICL